MTKINAKTMEQVDRAARAGAIVAQRFMAKFTEESHKQARVGVNCISGLARLKAIDASVDRLTSTEQRDQRREARLVANANRRRVGRPRLVKGRRVA